MIKECLTTGRFSKVLPCVLPNEEGSRNMDIKRPNNAKLWNFNTDIKKLEELTWNSFSFISENGKKLELFEH